MTPGEWLLIVVAAYILLALTLVAIHRAHPDRRPYRLDREVRCPRPGCRINHGGRR